MAAPMPLVEPVTMAVRSASRPVVVRGVVVMPSVLGGRTTNIRTRSNLGTA